MLEKYAYSPSIKFCNVKVFPLLFLLIQHLFKHTRVASAFLTATSGWELGFRACLYRQSGFLVDAAPRSRHGLCCLTPKCTTLAILKLIWIIQETPDDSHLSESLSNSLTLLSLPLPALIPNLHSNQWWKYWRVFGFQLCSHRSFTSNIPTSVRLPPWMAGFWDLTANQPKSNCNALYGLCCFGLERRDNETSRQCKSKLQLSCTVPFINLAISSHVQTKASLL